MATECTAYLDAKGNLHSNLEKATLEDLAGVLGRVGDEGGMTAGVARMIFDKRREIERVFAEHDVLVANKRAHTGEAGDVTQPNLHVIHKLSD
ncbi:hypothetical protein [Novosphingobium sp. 9]|uniref:hypothetical protein n=1 Tax=Novosphingobium sp. 9 TaxID=2025349 RepID=UPI0021B61BF7|nr:hypothetical protein [Novosphingobium sp. 9]